MCSVLKSEVQAGLELSCQYCTEKIARFASTGTNFRSTRGKVCKSPLSHYSGTTASEGYRVGRKGGRPTAVSEGYKMTLGKCYRVEGLIVCEYKGLHTLSITDETQTILTS